MEPKTSLVLIPGLAADGTLFAPQADGGLSFRVVDWIVPETGESLAAYARRMASRLAPERGLILGGVSMGGMVALEMAQYLHPRAVVLIASCRRGRDVAPVARAAARIAAAMPERTIVPPRLLWPAVALAFGARRRRDRDVLDALLGNAPPAFFQWGLRAILAWPGVKALDCPVRHVHGADDRLIPAGRVRANLLVPGAGHLVNVTHAAEVNAFLAEVLASA